MTKMKRLFKFKYHKLLALVVCVVFAYFIFSNPSVQGAIGDLGEFSYLGIFIAGFFLALGFTAPFSVGFFVMVNPANFPLAVIMGALGALSADMLLFKIIKFSFMDEFKRLEKTKPIKEIILLAEKDFSVKVRHYLLYILAGIIIASPLPDEIETLMLAGLTTIKPRVFALMCFLTHIIGITLMLLI